MMWILHLTLFCLAFDLTLGKRRRNLLGLSGSLEPDEDDDDSHVYNNEKLIVFFDDDCITSEDEAIVK